MIILEMLESILRGSTHPIKGEDWKENLIEDLHKFKAIMKKGAKNERN